MMKKNYIKPDTQVITLNVCQLICGTTTTPIAGDGETPPDGWEPANSRQHKGRSVWDDDNEEEY